MPKGKQVNIPAPHEYMWRHKSIILTLRGSSSAIIVVSTQDKVAEYRNDEKQPKLLMAAVRWFGQSSETVKREMVESYAFVPRTDTGAPR
jgi:hypothetical protein